MPRRPSWALWSSYLARSSRIPLLPCTGSLCIHVAPEALSQTELSSIIHIEKLRPAKWALTHDFIGVCRFRIFNDNRVCRLRERRSAELAAISQLLLG